MKPTQRADLLANIKATFVSFFSILMFVALGVGIFTGIFWTSPALEKAGNKAFEDGRLHHMTVTYPYGLTEGDMEKIEAIDGVDQVEGGYVSFQNIEWGRLVYSVKLQSTYENSDLLEVVEGELPKAPGEIALWDNSAEEMELGVGDVIRFAHDSEDGEGMRYLVQDDFVITAVVKSPEFIAYSEIAKGYSPDGAIDVLAWVAPSSYDADAFAGRYPTASIRSDELSQMNTFSKDYKARSEEIRAEIESLGVELAAERYGAIHDDAQSQIDDGQAQLDDARQKADDAQSEIDQGEATLVEKGDELEQGRQQVAEGQAELEAARAQIADSEATLYAAYEELCGKQARYDEAVYSIDRASTELGTLNDTVYEERVIQYDAEVVLADRITELNEQLENEELTQEDYDLQVETAQYECDAAKAASDVRIDDACDRAVASFADVGAGQLPTELDHTNVDVMIPIAADALANAYDTPIDIDGETMTLNEAAARLSAGWQEYNNGLAELDAARAELAEGEAELEAGKQKVAEGEQQLAEGRAELDDAKSELASGREEIDEKSTELDDARTALSGLKDYQWTVVDRISNGSAIEVSTFSTMTNHLSFSMAALFVIVGLLVSYSAVSRIVHEQVTQIGTKKALGLRSGEITLSFILYSSIAVIAGAIVGIILGVVVVEGIVGSVMAERFSMGNYPPHFGWPLTLIFTALELGLIIGATWIACRGILKQHAVELLRGAKPPTAKRHFYEKWGIWKKLPLFTQTMVNNCVNDKRRVFSTIVGVAGCTALIVTAITLNDDVMKSYDRQYNIAYGFNGIAEFDASVDGAAERMGAALDEQGVESTPVRRFGCLITKPDGTHAAVRLIIPTEEESFERLYHTAAIKGSEFDPDVKGVWVSRAYSDHIHAKVGDDLVFDLGDGEMRSLPIIGFFDFYLCYYEAIIPAAVYEDMVGESPQTNSFLVNTGDVEVSKVDAAIADTTKGAIIVDDKGKQRKDFDDFSSVSSVVVILYLVLAVIMALVVLLNLNVMFIEEKKRELIVLMINGFSVKDARRYIYNDTIVLSVIGIIVGLIVGHLMGVISVGSIEPETAHFFKGIAWTAIIIGAAGSGLLSYIMGKISLRRIPRFDLTDINKF